MAAAKKKPAEVVPEEGAASAPAEPDRVAMVSLRADGTPDQSEGFVVIVDE